LAYLRWTALTGLRYRCKRMTCRWIQGAFDRYDSIYLLTAVGLSPGGSTHLHTNNTQNDTNNNWTTQITTRVKECGLWPVFVSFTLTFVLQLRKNYGKTSVRVRKTSVRLRKTSVRVQHIYYQNTHTNTHIDCICIDCINCIISTVLYHLVNTWIQLFYYYQLDTQISCSFT